jgi:PAS domain S-box-containing protein
MSERVSILLVDDTPQNLVTLEAILESPGLELVCARSGREALRTLLDRDFAAILLDVNMPDLDGFEAASLIRGRQRSAHTPIIFLTAYPDEAQSGRGYALGAVDYMLTPVQPDVLRAKVGVFADLFRKTREIARQSELLWQAEEKLRRQAEEALRRADERLRLMIESVTDYAIFSIDRDGFVASWNAGAERLFLYAESQIIGRPADILWEGRVEKAAGPPSSPNDFGAASTAQGSQSLLHGEDDRWCFRKDGTRFCGNRLVTPLHDSEGRVHGSTVVVKDVTARREAESALRESEARLREADRRKDEFLAVLAHELRNPLAAIASATVVAQTPGLESKWDWCKEVIGRQVKHLTRLMDDLLDVSRITLGKIQLQRSHVDVRKVLARAIEAVQPLADAQHQQLDADAPNEPVFVYGDATRLEQVFINLLTNAVKYTPDHGRITLTAGIVGGEVVIDVRDTGIGIDPAMLPMVFELFAQADRGPERSRGGLGIGLSLARKLAELHGGTITATSEGRGHGSTFTVRLPRVMVAMPEAPVTRSPSQVAVPANRTVLIVDDNRDAAEALALFLQGAGYDVHAVHDGQAALDAADQQLPDVVLLDLGLPLLDGYQVAERLRLRPAGRGVRLIAVSGYGQEQDRRRTASAGFEHHLVKPIDYNALLSLLGQWKGRGATVAS